VSFGVPEDHPARQILHITILYRSALYAATVPTSAIQKALRVVKTKQRMFPAGAFTMVPKLAAQTESAM